MATAWPASWMAVVFRSRRDWTWLFLAGPATIFIKASLMSSMFSTGRFSRAARMAASFKRLLRSAPVKPEVARATVRRLTESSSFLSLAWTFRISSRPFTSGALTWICRSNRPGRSRAGSRMSGRLVAARTMMPSVWPKPSISTSSWFRVCSFSSWPPPRPVPRLRPTASISSMKIMAGATFFACSNRSRTRLAPTPTYISTKSEPEMERNCTPASPATARASNVLPVPGGPTRRMP